MEEKGGNFSKFRFNTMTSHRILPTVVLLFQLCAAMKTVVTLDTAQTSEKGENFEFEDSATIAVDGATNHTDCGNADEAEILDGKCQLTGEGDDNQSCKSPLVDEMSKSNAEECGVYLALSTLPGTGIGMFAGRSFEEGDELMEVGDHLIPIVSLPQHQGEDAYFLWDEYTWNPGVMRLNWEGVGTMVASPGFGAAANSFMDFVNVDEGAGVHTVAGGLHRSKDPGAGAFTSHHSRSGTAAKAIRPGVELFVDYSDSWYVL